MKALIPSGLVFVLLASGWAWDDISLRRDGAGSRAALDRIIAFAEFAPSTKGITNELPDWKDVESYPQYKHATQKVRDWALAQWIVEYACDTNLKMNQELRDKVMAKWELKNLKDAMNEVEKEDVKTSVALQTPIYSSIASSSSSANAPQLASIQQQQVTNEELLKKLSDQNEALSAKLDFQAIQAKNTELQSKFEPTSMFHDYTIMTPGGAIRNATVIDNCP